MKKKIIAITLAVSAMMSTVALPKTLMQIIRIMYCHLNRQTKILPLFRAMTKTQALLQQYV